MPTRPPAPPPEGQPYHPDASSGARRASACRASSAPPESSVAHPADLSSDDLLRDCEVTHGRGSGPGGQRRNKVQTAVRIRHQPTGIEAAARERASQAQNLSAAVFRLRVKLALEYRAARKLPSAMWTQRARDGRIACNPRHTDYPAMLAEALDHVTQQRGDVRRAAAALAVSSTQLLRFLAGQPQALQHVNELRRKRGLGALKA